MHIRIVYYKGKSDATFIRTLGFAKGFVQNGATASFSFLLPPEEGWRMNKNEGVSVDNLFDKCPRCLRMFKITMYLYSLCKCMASMDKDEIIFFSLPYLNVPLALVAKLKKVKYFMEFTEIPYYEIKPGFLRFFQSTSQIIAAKYANLVCVISKGLEEYYKHKGISNICVVNMFVDIDRFLSVEDGDSQDVNPNLISYCGSVSNYKDGVDILIKAFSIVHKSHPLARLRIIGSASDTLMNELKRLTINLSIDDSVEFAGRVPFETMPSLLKASGILALARPSSMQAQYGFPTKLGEYLCTSRPVVITRTGEIDQFLEDGVSCVFAKADNVEDFAEKVNWCLENYQKAEYIGKEGRQVAINNFSAQIESRKVIEALGNSRNY